MKISVLMMLISGLCIGYAMVGYPLLLCILEKIIAPKQLSKDDSYLPTVTYMIVAHNEEIVIQEKLQNAILLDYPKDKIQIIVTSDYSTDSTNKLVKTFIEEHADRNILLHETVEHKGKTNAQNEGQLKAVGEILVMTDANAMLKSDAIKELVSVFVDDDIYYVTGKLVYTNNMDSLTGDTEASYWNYDLKMRDIESRLQTITAGNGSIYAVRNSEYVDVPLIESHDSAMPYIYAKARKRAVFNPKAISFEKAGENNRDEFKRKVRMNRGILFTYKKMLLCSNILKYKWFPIFYFGHRTCRYSLWLMHGIFFVSSIVYSFLGNIYLGIALVVCQIVFWLLGIISIRHQIPVKLMRIIGYYSMTVIAQMVAVCRQIAGKSKPVWEKAESTR